MSDRSSNNWQLFHWSNNIDIEGSWLAPSLGFDLAFFSWMQKQQSGLQRMCIPKKSCWKNLFPLPPKTHLVVAKRVSRSMTSSALCPPSHHLEAQAIMITHRRNLASKRRPRDWEGITLTCHWHEGWWYREPAALNGYPGPVQGDGPRQLDLLHGRKPFVGDGAPCPEWRLNMA